MKSALLLNSAKNKMYYIPPKKGEYMKKEAIIKELAERRTVEAIARRICKTAPAKIADLVQLVYLALLETEEEKIQHLYQSREIDNYIARVVINQYYSTHSRFHYDNRRFGIITSGILDNEKDNNE